MEVINKRGLSDSALAKIESVDFDGTSVSKEDLCYTIVALRRRLEAAEKVCELVDRIYKVGASPSAAVHLQETVESWHKEKGNG